MNGNLPFVITGKPQLTRCRQSIKREVYQSLIFRFVVCGDGGGEFFLVAVSSPAMLESRTRYAADLIMLTL